MSLKLNLFTQIQNTSAPAVPAFRAGSAGTFSFGFEPVHDNFVTNPMFSGLNSKAEIEALAKSNPRIMAILKENNLPLKINMEALEGMV